MVGEVERHLHARVATADDEHLLALEGLAATVFAGVHNLALEAMDSLNLRYNRLRVLPCGHNEPFGSVLPSGRVDGLYAAAIDGADDGILGAHAPVLAVVLSSDDFLAEEGADAEGAYVLIDVDEELLLDRVCGVAAREGHEQQLAVVLGQVQAHPTVRAAVPHGGDALVTLQERVGNGSHGEPRRARQPRRPCAHDQGPR